MILQGKTRQALCCTGLLGIVGIGLLLLPSVPGATQPPGDEAKARRDREPGDRPKGDALENARFEIKRLQAEMERFREEMERRQQEMQREMQKRIQHLQALANFQDVQRAQGQQGQKDRDPGKPPGRPGDEKKPFDFSGPGGRGNPVDQRLMEVERKLDALLHEVRSMRQDMKKGPGDPARRQPGPGGAFQPERKNPRPPEGGPTPPNPPTPPRPRDGDAFQNPLSNPPNIPFILDPPRK